MKQRSLNHFVGVLNAVIMVVFSATVYSQGPDVDKLKEEVSSQDKKIEDQENKIKEIEEKLKKIASDDDKYDGDKLRLRVNVHKFRTLDIEECNKSSASEECANKSKEKCATKGSKFYVTRDRGTTLSVRFKDILSEKVCKECKEGDTECNKVKAECEAEIRSSKNYPIFADCPIDCRVNDYTQYLIDKSDLEDIAYARHGITFGGLVVPFKYYLGGEKRISGSATVAPYIGYRWFDVLGMQFTPVGSAGLGLISVENSDTKETSTKPALSLAGGMLLTHSKNSDFNAGILIGKDFLSKSDRAGDSTVTKFWTSLYFGLSF